MRKSRKPDAALQALYAASRGVYKQIMAREVKIAELQDEIRNLRANALMPIERLCESRNERLESERQSEWISEPIYDETR